jgi:hypothetical protein
MTAAEVVAMGRLQYVLQDWMLRSPPVCLHYLPNRNTSAALGAVKTLAANYNAKRVH